MTKLFLLLALVTKPPSKGLTEEWSQYMNLQFLSQRGVQTKKSFDFQCFSHSAGNKNATAQVGYAYQAMRCVLVR
jgi:hypothetical protein